MPNSGYPTPDSFEGTPDFVCIPLIVPNKPEFKAAIYGLYGQMSNSWFWKELGTMSPETAAWLSSRGLGITNAYGDCGVVMSCEDIADCIETSEDVAIALTENQIIVMNTLKAIANSGTVYPQIDADVTTVDTSTAGIGNQKTEPIKELPSCDLDALWAGIRDGIVQRLDDNARSALEWLVTKADVAERANAAIGMIPVLGDIANGVITQLVELAPDMLNLYEAYSSIEHLDEIACEIFGIVCSQCRYPTYEEVFQYYAAAGITGFDDLDNIVIAAATDFLIGSSELAALAFYHTLIAYELLILYMGSKFHNQSGTSALVTMASLGEDFANDNWMTLCEDCDEPYSIYVWDFTTGQHGMYLDPASDNNPADEGVYQTGMGWRLTGSAGQRLEVAIPIDTSWEIRAIGMKTTGNTINARSLITRPVLGSTTGGVGRNIANGSGEYNHCIDGLVSITGFAEIAIAFQSVDNDPPTYFTKMAIIFNRGFAPTPELPTNDNTLCS